MDSLEEAHEKVLANLLEIQEIFDDMLEDGLGGTDFADLYMKQKLIPDAFRIFKGNQT